MTLLLVALLAPQFSPEVTAHINAGVAARKAGQLDVAIREFAQVVQLIPQVAAAHVNLGAAYFDKRDYTHAIPALRRALELDSNLPGARAMLGTALLVQGYVREALPHLEATGDDGLLGVTLLELGKPREALDRFETALQKTPDQPDLLYYVARTHAELARLTGERLQKLHPGSPRAQQLQAEAAAVTGDRERARRLYEAALGQRPDLTGVHLALGELFLSAGDYSQAEPHFRAEAELRPGSPEAAYKLGLVLLNLGRKDEALTELTRANQLAPDMPEILLELARALLAAGRLEEAEGRLQRLLQLEPASDLARAAHFQLAQICRRTGRDAQAKQHLESFRKLQRP